MPIPISVFPSAYRNDTTAEEDTKLEVEGEFDSSSRRGRDGRKEKSNTKRRESHISVEEDRRQRPSKRDESIRIYEERDDRPSRREKDIRERNVDIDLDIDVDRRRYVISNSFKIRCE